MWQWLIVAPCSVPRAGSGPTTGRAGALTLTRLYACQSVTRAKSKRSHHFPPPWQEFLSHPCSHRTNFHRHLFFLASSSIFYLSTRTIHAF